MDVNPKPKPPLPGGEFTFMSDTGPQPVPPGIPRVNLIAVGDGGPGPLYPRARRNRHSAAWLELVVSFEAGTKPAVVMLHTNRMMQIAIDAAPELGLRYDVGRMREEGDAVVVALKSRKVAGAAERLAEVADVIRKATAAVPDHGPVLVRVA